jgi:hypothetical protein
MSAAANRPADARRPAFAIVDRMNGCPLVLLVGVLAPLPAQQALFTGFGPNPNALTGERFASGGPSG